MIRLNLVIPTVFMASSLSFAAPMPNTIIVQDKAVVPVLKTEVIRRIEGQKPVRHVEATILEMTNKGQDVVAKEVVFEDNLQQFSEKKLAIPVVQRGGVIVPTAKMEVNSTLKQDGVVILKNKTVDAAGVEFKADQVPVKRGLNLEQQTDAGQVKSTHVVLTEDGIPTRDVYVTEEAIQSAE